MNESIVGRALAGVPVPGRLRDAIARWRAFAESPLGARLLPIYAVLLGAGAGVLIADRLVRSMWRHAIFTDPYQWRVVALLLTLFWIAIGAVAALALLGPPDGEPNADGDRTDVGEPAP